MKFLMMMFLAFGLLACDPVQTVSGSQASSTHPSPYQDIVLETGQLAPVQIDYTPLAQPRVYYYSPDGQLVDKAVSQGFTRKILGNTADGRMVVQDYFSGSLNPQTSPFILSKNGDEHIFDKSVIDSRLIWYDDTGEITSTANFQAGVQQGWLDVYRYRQLAMQVKNHDGGGVDVRFFSPDERIWGEAYLKPEPNPDKSKTGIVLEQLVFFHANGQKMSEMTLDAQNQPSNVRSYDEHGKPIDAKNNAEHNQILLRRFALLMQMYPGLIAR